MISQSFLGLLFCMASGSAVAHLDDDEQLKLRIKESKEVSLVRVINAEVTDVRGSHGLITLHATVVEDIRGTVKEGENIRVSFGTDALPLKEKARSKLIEDRAMGYQGALRVVFLGEGKKGGFDVDWTDVVKLSEDLLPFLRTNAEAK
ncbi:MAG: hypothetical protein JWO08_1144 [Verrucomicrobiaceae bacterium]|nr:hypothetical protein [Verrucomicrobiaceae bacterium]